MSLSGGAVIIAVTIIRAVLINRLPKKTFLFLWSLAFIRLLVPFSIPYTFSFYSLFNTNSSPEDTTALLTLTELLTSSSENLTVSPSIGGVALTDKTLFSWDLLWLTGFIVFMVIFATCYLFCLQNFKTSLPISTDYVRNWLREHSIRRNISVRQSDRISSPLTYGVLRPVILLPKTVDLNNRQQLEFIFKHELVHICHFDLVTKLIATITLCIHWFNPFVWIMYILLNRDLELSCDEAVIQQSNKATRADYARTLISMEEHRSVPSLLFSNFSKNVMEERIVAIMKPKKYTLLGALGALSLVAIIATCFLTSAQAAETENTPDTAEVSKEGSTEFSEEIASEADINEMLANAQTDKEELETEPEKLDQNHSEPVAGTDSNVSSSLLMIWPTESVTLSLTFGPNGERVHPLTGEIMKSDHICIKGERGDDVYAAISGTVTEAAYVSSYGNHIVITNADGITTIYAHLQDISVAVGDTVTAGDLIGTLGATGLATGPNLAFSVVENGTAVDPMSYFK